MKIDPFDQKKIYFGQINPVQFSNLWEGTPKVGKSGLDLRLPC